ncbi:hypothetical protein TVAG_200160 [Trichomonas vaginalis G3]|uniref:Uncharacterized protein n=1 Tax=Trichomonas vaginalis (strain ATCC PRA-98 / G3) TaxID=412133 RepID=A2G226_TRIV3|nr:hypothetical protein TVAGG3_0080920 [Trichomonas vaginalis G3]EAX88784.1 hypothetical protein TVAG_200160 [Trichomonas vaginalis G3]KAI5543240.1 hypothetical protein TVAGG3_0080920 [Trichomonas vaginalis G3]|eukprot:XP_001301714.1 hypothetical protein [Trichomonas vaginalis G3]
MEDEAFIQHRQQNTDEVELIDSDKQDEIVNNMKKDYEGFAKTQNIFFIVLSVSMILLCLFLTTQVEHKIIPLIYAIPHAVSLAAHFIQIRNSIQIIVIVELISIILSLFTLKYFNTFVAILLHLIFLLIFYLKCSATKFRNEFGTEISDLEKKKYSYKAA